MDKQTLNSYGWVVVAVIIICILINLATPFASVIRANIENVVGGMQDIGENAWENDDPTDFGDLSYIKDTRTGPVLAEKQTWYKGSTAKANIKQIDILTSYTPESTPDEQWIADADGAGTIMCYVEGEKLTIAGDGSDCIKLSPNASETFMHFVNVISINNAHLLNTSEATTMDSMFDCDNIKTAQMALRNIDVARWDTSSVTSMRFMFYGCANLISVDVSRWDVSKVQNMQSMFYECSSLASLNVSRWDVGNVKNMKQMFSGYNQACVALKTLDASNWDVSSVQTMEKMFKGCSALEYLGVANWNPANVTNMSYMFDDCFALETLDVSNWDVSNVQNMNGMFSGDGDFGATKMALKTLDVSKWNTGNVTNMAFMFYGFNGGVTLDVSNWDVSKVSTFDHMFAHSYVTLAGDNVANWSTDSATNLNGLFLSVSNTVLDVSNFKTDNVTVFAQMFEKCPNLQQIIGLENFNTANGVDFTDMFHVCTNLQTLDLSSFDTRNAKDGVVVSSNGSESCTLFQMFKDCKQLKQITVGPNFSFNGDGTTTDATHVGMMPDTASGYWYTADGTAYTPTEIATTLNQTANTYYRTNPAA